MHAYEIHDWKQWHNVADNPISIAVKKLGKIIVMSNHKTVFKVPLHLYRTDWKFSSWLKSGLANILTSRHEAFKISLSVTAEHIAPGDNKSTKRNTLIQEKKENT